MEALGGGAVSYERGTKSRGAPSIRPVGSTPGLECRVYVLELRVSGLGLKDKSLGFGVLVSGFRVQGSGFRIESSGLRVSSSGTRLSRVRAQHSIRKHQPSS